MVPGRTDNVCVRHYKILIKAGPPRQVNARPIRTQGGRFVQWQKVPACQASAGAPASDSPEALEAPQAAAGAGRGSRASMGEAAASAQQPQSIEASETSARARKHQRASKDQAAAYEGEERSDAPPKASANDRKRRRASESHAPPSASEAHASSAGAKKHCIGLQTQAASCTEEAHLHRDPEASAGADKRQQASEDHAAASAEAAQPEEAPMPPGHLGPQSAKANDRQHKLCHTADISRSADCHKAAETGTGQGSRGLRPATRSQAAVLDIASADRSNAGHAVRTRKHSRRHKSGQD